MMIPAAGKNGEVTVSKGVRDLDVARREARHIVVNEMQLEEEELMAEGKIELPELLLKIYGDQQVVKSAIENLRTWHEQARADMLQRIAEVNQRVDRVEKGQNEMKQCMGKQRDRLTFWQAIFAAIIVVFGGVWAIAFSVWEHWLG